MTTNTSTRPDRPATTLVIGGTGMSGRRLAARPDGRNAQLSDGVRRVLGRPPTDFADWARAAAANGAWRT